MMDGGDLGTLEAGKLADLILVNGDVLADVAILTDRERILLVMKDGQVQRAAPSLKQSTPSPALEAAE
jgi:imidazolonepropionase-like amidohydrolase